MAKFFGIQPARVWGMRLNIFLRGKNKNKWKIEKKEKRKNAKEKKKTNKKDKIETIHKKNLT